MKPEQMAQEAKRLARASEEMAKNELAAYFHETGKCTAMHNFEGARRALDSSIDAMASRIAELERQLAYEVAALSERDKRIAELEAKLQAAEALAEQYRKDAERWQAIREAHKALQIYVYEDPADACSGDWRYNPDPSVVDEFADGLIAERAAIDNAIQKDTK